MKGPSLEAIRKFKQLQEEKRRLEEDQKVKEKLTILEHRASRGDKKAKTQLKQIEKVEEERSKPPELRKHNGLSTSGSKGNPAHSNANSAKQGTKSSSNRPKSSGFDFDELMKLAASNTNEVKQEEKKETAPKIKRPHERPPPPPGVLPTQRERPSNSQKQVSRELPPTQTKTNIPRKSGISMHPSASKITSSRAPRSMSRHPVPDPPKPRLPPRRDYYDDDYDDEDEDEYESDGFIVDDDDEQVRNELDATLRSVFRYDKRRCDLREQQLDRLDRAIGRVSTFEDLEREERRASRLAAAEDAEALRDLEERKRLKKQRLKDMRR